MEIILKDDIGNLGFKDDIVNVKPGYARNYLIPAGKAIIASESAKKMLAEELKQRAHKLAALKTEAEELGAKVMSTNVKVLATTSNKGVIYGSVTNIHVAEALKAAGVEVDRKKIVVKETIKEVGDYVAQVRLHREVILDLPFHVESENAAAEIAAMKAAAEAARQKAIDDEAAHQAAKAAKAAALAKENEEAPEEAEASNETETPTEATPTEE